MMTMMKRGGGEAMGMAWNEVVHGPSYLILRRHGIRRSIGQEFHLLRERKRRRKPTEDMEGRVGVRMVWWGSSVLYGVDMYFDSLNGYRDI